MGMVMDMKTCFGVTFKNAYIRAYIVGGGAQTGVWNIALRFYASEKAAKEGMHDYPEWLSAADEETNKPLVGSRYSMPYNENPKFNILKEAYMFLHKLPEFKDATPVLEERETL